MCSRIVKLSYTVFRIISNQSFHKDLLQAGEKNLLLICSGMPVNPQVNAQGEHHLKGLLPMPKLGAVFIKVLL